MNRNRKNILYIIIMAITNSCGNSSSEQKMPISKVFENYYEEKLVLNPLEATMTGDSRYNDVFRNDISESHRAALKTFYISYQNKLKEYDRNTLPEKDRLSYDILNYECAIQLEELQFHAELIPINQFASMHLTMGQFAGGTSVQPFKTVKDYENWMSRLDGFAEWCDTAVENMKRGMKHGYVLQKVLAGKVIEQFASLDHGPVKDHLFYKPVLSMPKEFSEADKEKISKSYEDKINNKIIPAFKKLHDFFKNEYLPSCRKTDGLSGLPDGNKLYEHRVKLYTTTNLTPDSIFEIGQKEVRRISGEMEKVMKQVGYKGDLISFFNHVRENKKLMPYKTAEDVISHFNAIHDTIKIHLGKLFDLTPNTAFEIRRTEAFREKTASAEYIPGAWDGSRPAIFYVPVPNATEYNVYADEDLFLHEAIPGHHYQISLQQEDTTLPKFRRGSWYCAYGEGWALYTESLGKELGLYTDPYQYFGMLSMEMHRSIRLVVDVGIHYKGWTREEAIKYSMEHEAEPEHMIISEIERYMAYPGQALSYKIGQLKILELRAKAEKTLGSKFNIREFHNQLLESGCLPLLVLENKINKWIGSKK